jgi:hypothetical protein
MKDNVIYDELWSVLAPLGTELKGEPAVVQDVFGFYMKDAEVVDEEVCFVYRDRQVDADKRTGSGEQILAGDRLYYYPSDRLVSPTAAGTFGVDYYFCGWAKKDAAALDEHVLMNFDGTRWDEDV